MRVARSANNVEVRMPAPRFPILGTYLSPAVETARASPLAEHELGLSLSLHARGEAGDLGDDHFRRNLAVMRRWRDQARAGTDGAVLSRFSLSDGTRLYLLTSSSLTAVYTWDDYRTTFALPQLQA
jgi:hypothetical protein